MSYTVAPDVTTRSLSVQNAETSNPGLMMTQVEVGVDRMASLGVGLELDSSAYDLWVARWRGVLRDTFGPDISGWSFGMAISF